MIFLRYQSSMRVLGHVHDHGDLFIVPQVCPHDESVRVTSTKAPTLTSPSTPAKIARDMGKKTANPEPGLNPGVTVGLVVAVAIVLILVAVVVVVVVRLRLSKPSSAQNQRSVESRQSNGGSTPDAQTEKMSTKTDLPEEVQGQQNV